MVLLLLSSTTIKPYNNLTIKNISSLSQWSELIGHCFFYALNGANWELSDSA